ncbi:ankyrin repeat domain-containing protein [Chryseobacterium taiwanense]|uniref:Uncharacterized protein n=1 Tax=Chryseobacterium taiwanense TaxID=363331 RepID=A0A0B4D394_9FLAO|nr:ankyrin repeat domain-containing protein [Chryseobacterium taiwanense]KIC61146.1 hypothetical protein RM51_18775 [Chryseobacterium taiwanense]
MCRAAEFPWFNVQGFEGWVEYTTNTSADRRINVLPKLYGPAGVGEFGGANVDPSKLVVIRPNGDIVIKYLILSSTAKLPMDFRTNVAKSIIGNGFKPSGFDQTGLDNYQLVIPKIKNITVKVIIDGNVIKQETLGNTFTSSEYTGDFLFKTDDENYSNIYNGDFKISLDYEFPYETFSGLSLKIDQTALTNIKVEAFREVIRKAKSSGSKMWFIDTRKKTIKTIEKERISTSSTSSYTNNVDIVLRDPDETILKHLDNLLGYVPLSKNDFISRHAQLQATALAASKPELGKLSAEYVKATEDNNEPAQIDILASLAALEKGDILSFFASGVSFKQSSTSASYSFSSILETSVSSTESNFYTMNIIKTLDYSYRTQITEFPHLNFAIQNSQNNRNFEVFGTLMPNINQINAVVLSSVQSNNLTNLRYALLKGGNPNVREPIDLNPALNIAVSQKRTQIISELLKSGANPNLPNRHGETAVSLSSDVGDINIRAMIRSWEERKGQTKLSIGLDPKFAISNVSINFNGMVKNFKPEYDAANQTWFTKAIEEYPCLYNMNAVITLWTKVETQYNSQTLHSTFLNAGFTATYSTTGYTYTKMVPIYDRIKIINGGNNSYNYNLIVSQNLYISEANGKTNDIFTPVQSNDPLDGVMFKF